MLFHFGFYAEAERGPTFILLIPFGARGPSTMLEEECLCVGLWGAGALLGQGGLWGSGFLSPPRSLYSFNIIKAKRGGGSTKSFFPIIPC